MIKYNDRNIFVGHIKQLLNSFNLPVYRVYDSSFPAFEGSSYIYQGNVVTCLTAPVKAAGDDHYTISTSTPKTFRVDRPFNVNLSKLKTVKGDYELTNENESTHLTLKNDVYDTATHIYLGKYLRFLRDYYHLDLMSLYNCFTRETLQDKVVSYQYQNVATSINIDTKFDSSNSNYKIYSIPVELFNGYTIALDCDCPVEVICDYAGDTDAISIDELFDLHKLSYKKFAHTNFNTPVYYDKLIIEQSTYLSNIFKRSSRLRLLIKVPTANTSSLVVLEGKFIENNKNYSFTNNKSVKYQSVVQDFNFKSGHPSYYQGVSALQLLKINSGVNYPFSDRLYEYLTGNVISGVDKIPDNIKRVQQSLYKRSEQGLSGISSITDYGVWNTKYRQVLYRIAYNSGLLDTAYDVLGYVDKDVEKLLRPEVNLYTNS